VLRGGALDPIDRPVPCNRYFLALLAIAILTAVCGESTGGSFRLSDSALTILREEPNSESWFTHIRAAARKPPVRTPPISKSPSQIGPIKLRRLVRATSWRGSQ
jgi:hypothetical protein